MSSPTEAVPQAAPHAPDDLPYRRVGGEVLIELRLRTLQQLFNSLDPSPFLEKDLDDDAEAYVLAAAREHPRGHALRIVLHLPASELDTPEAATVEDSVRNYFSYRGRAARRALREHFRAARAALLLGLAFLAACLAGREIAASVWRGSSAELLDEGLLILGWVAMWRPLELFLYDWAPLARSLRTYRRLAATPVELRAAP